MSFSAYAANFIHYVVPLILFFVTHLHCRYKLNYWTKRGVQQLKSSHKVFGDFKNGILFRTAVGCHLREIYRQSAADAPYVGFYIFHKPCLLLKDPKIIKQILVRDSENFLNRHFGGAQQMDSIGNINLFGLNDPAWRYLRKRITPTLTTGKLKRMLPLMLGTGKSMVEYLENSIGTDKSKVIDAQDVYFKYTADLFANVALGIKTNSFNNSDSDYTECLMSFFYSFKRKFALMVVFLIPVLVDIIGSSVLFDIPFVRQLFWSALESRERCGEKRGDYIDSIIKLKNAAQNPIYKFEGMNLWYQSGALLSGFESSSTASAFTLMELAKNVKSQERVRDDIIRAIDRHGWTMEAFNSMRYLDQCIAEAIRLHPPVPLVDRCTLQSYKIPNTDTVIEEGTPIYISLYGLHGDPQYFHQPDVFDPDRFGEGGSVPDAYMPFGVGPRKCVGTIVGRLFAKVVLSLVLTQHQVATRASTGIVLDSSSLTAAADGLFMEFSKLTSKETCYEPFAEDIEEIHK